jgi:aryl-alcohol dehydrogenase-like predicted oxidoreductase
MSKNQLSKIVLGTAQFNSGYGRFNKKHLNENEILKLLNFCRANKISYLDTANNYDQVFEKLDTKILSYFKIIYKFKPSLKKTYKSILKDLLLIKKNFNFNKIYCFMLHNENDLKKFKINYLASIQKLKKKKIIKKFGISIYNFNKLDKYILDENIDLIQLPYNVFDNRFLKKRIQTALSKRKTPIEIHARSIFLQGLLLQNSKIKDQIVKKNNDLFKRWDAFNNFSKNKKIENCINYVKNNKKINKILIGIDSLEQLKIFIKSFAKKDNKNLINFNSKNKISVIDPRRWIKI